jgi:hypothetical protein
VVLLDVQNYCITSMDVCKGTLDESLVHPREIFRPVIVHAAAGFVLVHNHPVESGSILSISAFRKRGCCEPALSDLNVVDGNNIKSVIMLWWRNLGASSERLIAFILLRPWHPETFIRCEQRPLRFVHGGRNLAG